MGRIVGWRSLEVRQVCALERNLEQQTQWVWEKMSKEEERGDCSLEGLRDGVEDYLLNFLLFVIAPVSLMPKAFREVWRFFQTRNHLRVCKEFMYLVAA